MRRLHWQLYLTLLLPDSDAPSAEVAAALTLFRNPSERVEPTPIVRRREELLVSATVWGSSGERVASTGMNCHSRRRAGAKAGFYPVEAKRTLLAGVSHELRSPLTRIRMAMVLLGEEVREELRERILKDISELDALLGELLLASRLDTLESIEAADEVDLLALAVEQARPFGADVSGEKVTL